MLLIKCKECGADVDKKADSCPNCGARINRHIVIKTMSVIVTILTLVMTVISICIASESLDIAEKSLDVSKQATDISDTALRISSANTEPLFRIDIDEKNNKLTIQHETHEIYQIKYVYFGKVNTIAIMKSDSEDINGTEIIEKYAEKPLIKGRSDNVGGCSEEEAAELNKRLEISLEEYPVDNSTQCIISSTRSLF